MELLIGRDELNRALSRVQGIVEKRSTNPILSHVRLTASASGLKVSATDSEVSFVGEYPAQVSVPGDLTLPARLLHDMARSVSSDTVRMRLLDPAAHEVEISAGRSRFTLRGMDAAEFPPVIEGLPGEGFLVTSAHLRDLIENTLFSVSPDDTRTGLNGTFVQRIDRSWTGGPALRFVSTDGHRLSLCDRPFQGVFGAAQGILLPRKGLAELRKLCDEVDAVFEVLFGQREAVFRRGSLTFAMRLLEGEFPDYPQVIPEEWQRRIVVGRTALMDSLRRVNILATDKGSSVALRVTPEGLCLESRQTEHGHAIDEVEAQVEGSPLEIGFNARYFLDALGVMGDDAIVLEFGDALLPCLVKPLGVYDRLFVIMPVRL